MIRLIAILLLVGSLGCSWAITSEGAFANFGQATMSTCGTVDGTEATERDCTVIGGAPISEQASNVIGGVLSGALRMLGLSYGVPTAPAPAE